MVIDDCKWTIRGIDSIRETRSIHNSLIRWINKYQCWRWLQYWRRSVELKTDSDKHQINSRSWKSCRVLIQYNFARWLSEWLTISSWFNRRYRLLHCFHWSEDNLVTYLHAGFVKLPSNVVFVSNRWWRFGYQIIWLTTTICGVTDWWINLDWCRQWLQCFGSDLEIQINSY